MRKVCLLICLLCGLNSCKQKLKEVHYTLPQGLKDYFNWAEGTYWVFTDSLTGDTDSFAVFEAGTTLEPVEGGGYTGNSEVFLSNFREYNVGDTSWRWSLHISKVGDVCVSSLLTLPPNNWLAYLFTEGFPFGTITLSDNTSTDNLASIEINSKVYYDVYRYRYTYKDGRFDEILVNAQSGLIKMSFDDSVRHQVLLLEKAHIVHK